MEFDIKPIWPDWEIVELLGAGSFGSVYKAVRHEQDLVVYSARLSLCAAKAWTRLQLQPISKV